ncbi:MAG: gamma-glutamyltransferase [Acidiferrobacterales bacterium]|nr:gamma-glutamyltransferase [Acidiferrobacterales bacterium]
MRLTVLLASALLAQLASAQTQTDPEAEGNIRANFAVETHEYMIAAANPIAAAAGDQIMAAGGSAVDAAIAALLVLNVVEPQSSGIGGGAFALVHSPSGLTSWDAREKAPAGVTPGLFIENGLPLKFPEALSSGRSIGVPGLLRLMERLHGLHGKLPWVELFQPAVRLARDGFEVSSRLAHLLDSYSSRLLDSDAAQVFFSEQKPLSAGRILKQPELAGTLERIAENGAGFFYTGQLAHDIVAAASRNPRPGTLSLDDLDSYEIIERPAICHPFRKYRICGMGPPSSGATTVGQILMLLDEFELEEFKVDEPMLWHLFASASRLAYADRAYYLADADFIKVPVKGLLDRDYIRSRSQLFEFLNAPEEKAVAGEPPQRSAARQAPDLQVDLPGTTHISVIDRDGLAVSLTASIETAFGSGRMAGGVLLNSQLTDFSFRAWSGDGLLIANAPAAGKRPRSSMSPTIVYSDDKPLLIAGSPGGNRIPEYVAQSLLAMLVYNLDPAEASALPHISHRNSDRITVEPHTPARVVDGLQKLGYEIEVRNLTSGLNIIQITPAGVLIGGSDPRREGVAAGR